MPRRGIFLNYRQNDASGNRLPHALVVEAIAEQLRRHFGRDAVFVDTGLRIGAHYPAELRAKLEGSEVLIAVIHDTWLRDLEGRRGRPDKDWVHDEIAWALKSRITVMPLLVDDATLPAKDQLPDLIGDVVFPQAHRIRFGHWERDVRLLIQALENHVAPVEVLEHEVPRVPQPRSWVEVVAAFVLGVLIPVLPIVLLADTAEQRRDWLGGVSLIGLVVLFCAVVLTGVAYRIRQQLDAVEAEAATMAGDKRNVIVGVTVISFTFALLVINNDLDYFVLLLVLVCISVGGIMFGQKWVLRLRKANDWPKPVLDVHPADLRQAVHRVDEYITEHQPLLNRLQRDQALFALDQIDDTAARLAELRARGRWAWQRTERLSFWVRFVLLGVTTGGVVGALVAHWAASGTGVLVPLIAVAGVASAVGCTWGVVEFGYRQQYWRKGIVLDAVAAAVKDLRDRLAESSIPPAGDDYERTEVARP
ncbi:TIR domain-containing protein [Saccharothrix deserti]|uniref:TIR domain-containing protein n=1 Tax=Saccharothrix deserti TaxID=2593674 RepID=UPI00131AE268|nr:TIR domain-containing protein [Saccharothrix deserti]